MGKNAGRRHGGFGNLSKAWRIDVRDPVVAVFLLVTVFYLGLVFPLCFFRHDDWWILGNAAVHLPQDWNFLWRPSLFHEGRELVWFFRPFFKLITYIFYQAFHFQYYSWLMALFLMFVATVYIGYRALMGFAGETAARTFAVFFTAAVPLHLGSLAWAGEGLMNVPQGLLLMICTACWMHLLRHSRPSRSSSDRDHASNRAWSLVMGLGLVAFTLAIGFKESTVFHLALLAGLALSDAPRKQMTTWVAYGLPFAVLAAIYLGIRLGYMPWNPSYKPEFSAQLWFMSLAKFLSVPLASAALWVALDAGLDSRRWKAWGRAFFKRVFWLPYFAVSVVIYLGQDFFSPGWWYVPSLSLALLLALCQQELGTKAAISKTTASFALLAFALSLCVWNFNRIGWWHWSGLQKQVHSLIKASDPASIRALSFYACVADQYPDVPLVRVVGDPEALQNQWNVIHGNRVRIQLKYCELLDRDLRAPASLEAPGEAVFQWNFPRLKPLGENAKRLASLIATP